MKSQAGSFRERRWWAWPWLVVVAAGCFSGGDEASHDGDSGAVFDAGTASGGFVPRAACSVDGDCKPGERCVPVGDVGPLGCVTEMLAPIACMPNVPQDCCEDADCAEGRCGGVLSSPVECSSTAGFDFRNQCLVDACVSDVDCGESEVCSPEGLFPSRACIMAACKSDADCDDEPDGLCVLFNLGCCQTAIGGGPSRIAQLACAYPGAGCQVDADCSVDSQCQVRDGRTECRPDCL